MICLCLSWLCWGRKLANHYISLYFLTFLRLEAYKPSHFFVFLDYPEAGNSQPIIFPCVSWFSWGWKLANHYISLRFLTFLRLEDRSLCFLTFLRLEARKPLYYSVFLDFPEAGNSQTLYCLVFLDYPEIGNSQNIFLTFLRFETHKPLGFLVFLYFPEAGSSQTIVFPRVSWLSWGLKLTTPYISLCFDYLEVGRSQTIMFPLCFLTFLRLETHSPLYFLAFLDYPEAGNSHTIIFLCVSWLSWGWKLASYYISLCYLTFLRLETHKPLYFFVFLDYPEAGSSQTIIFPCVFLTFLRRETHKPLYFFVFLDFPETGSSQTIMFPCVFGLSWGWKRSNHSISLCFLNFLRLEARKPLYFFVFLGYLEVWNSQTIVYLHVSWLSWGWKLANHYISPCFLTILRLEIAKHFLDFPEAGNSIICLCVSWLS